MDVISPVVSIVLAVVKPLAVPLKVPVIIPVEKLPLPSLFTIVLGVLFDVAEFTEDATVVIVDDKTPPILFIIAVPVTSAVPLNAGLV